MPASLQYSEMNPVVGYDDPQRTMQLAFELSMMGLNGAEDENGSVTNLSTSGLDSEAARKRSANMTECVPVPSSEHVAEIVGRQGCKIKALRAKTNTYIKTPVRGEEPVFVVTGRKEDVNAAKREILSAAEHFSQIRASRRNSSVSSVSSNGSTLTPGPPSPNAPGQVTIQVRVPYRVVGLVVGPKGATIKRIQQQTHTYIVTPSRDKEPVFEVTGLTENVDKARQEIESHIALRTGGLVDSQNEDDFHNNGVDSGFHELNGSSDYNGFNKSPTGLNGTCAYNNLHNALNGSNQDGNIFSFPPVNGSTKISDFAPVGNGFINNGFNGFGIYDNDEGIGGSPSFDPIQPPPSLWPEFNNDNQSSPLVSIFGNTSTTCSTSSNGNVPRRSSSLNGGTGHRLSPTLTDSPSPPNGMINGSLPDRASPVTTQGEHAMVRRIRSDPLTRSAITFGTLSSTTFPTTSGIDASSCNTSLSASMTTSVVDVTRVLNGVSCPVQVPTINGRPRRQCFMCSESDIVAALVPCGHNLFCMECANLIVEKPQIERSCPVCQQAPTQAIRIFS